MTYPFILQYLMQGDGAAIPLSFPCLSTALSPSGGPPWTSNHVPAQPIGLEGVLTWRAGRRLCWLGMTFIDTIPLVSF